MRKVLLGVAVCGASCLALCSCQRGPGQVANKVMADFGLKSKPEGYVSAGDKVFERLNTVGEAELKRLNQAEQKGTVKFQQQSELKGKYYKEMKVYEGWYPIEVQAVSSPGESQRGFLGYVEYSYRFYQSERANTPTEASAKSPDIATDTTGREKYRYTFNQGGEWNGAKGEKARK